jgi:hypothetical protein
MTIWCVRPFLLSTAVKDLGESIVQRYLANGFDLPGYTLTTNFEKAKRYAFTSAHRLSQHQKSCGNIHRNIQLTMVVGSAHSISFAIYSLVRETRETCSSGLNHPAARAFRT